MILSFGWTTPALLAGQKTVTRRDWTDSHAQKFVNLWANRETVDAWNTSPRNVRGNPHKIATLRLTAEPILADAGEAPDSDFEAEGFAYLAAFGYKINGLTPRQLWDLWKAYETPLWVIRFEVLSYD